MSKSKFTENIKGSLKKIARRFGLKIAKIDTPMRSIEIGLDNLAKLINPTYVIDIGVDYGSPELYVKFPSTKHKYILIEADPANADVLKKIQAKLDARAENVFCGAQEGTVQFYTASNHVYSSKYKLIDKGDFNPPISVSVKTLDYLTERERSANDPSFLLKIDVEGAELDVLRGATETLKHTVAIDVELSIAPKFENGPAFGEVVSFLLERGFAVFDLCSGFDRRGKLYQLNAVFVRTDAPFRLP